MEILSLALRLLTELLLENDLLMILTSVGLFCHGGSRWSRYQAGPCNSLTKWRYSFKLVFFEYLFNIHSIDTKTIVFFVYRVYTFLVSFFNLVEIICFSHFFSISNNQIPSDIHNHKEKWYLTEANVLHFVHIITPNSNFLAFSLINHFLPFTTLVLTSILYLGF